MGYGVEFRAVSPARATHTRASILLECCALVVGQVAEQFVSHIRERLTLRVCDTQRVFTQHVFKYCGGNRHFLFLWVSGLQVVLIDASDGQRMPCRVVEA
ncbi:hypothetical protein ACVTE8_14690, partial [Staphylococcus aureus]